MINKVRSIFLVGLVALVLGGCSPRVQPTQLPVTTPNVTEAIEFVFLATESGQTVLEATQALATVETKTYDVGVMVEGINGKKADAAHFWALYVNGEMAQAGADSVKLIKDDKVDWKYEKVN